MFNRIFGFFLVFATVVCGPVVRVYAGCQCDDGGMCGDNEYCDCQYVYGNEEPLCSCIACSTNNVPNATCDGCMVPPPNCSDYVDTCPSGVPAGKKCKAVSGCSTSGCQKYDVCDPNTGNTEAPVVSGNCHLEGDNNACKPNTLSCSSNFTVGSVASGCDWGLGGTGCVMSGNASWNGSKWDVSGCKCKKTSDNSDIANKRCKGNYILTPSSSNNITAVGGQIKYKCEPEHYYCTMCENESNPSVGLCPAGIVANSESNQCYNFNNSSAAYVACKCAPVQADYYVATHSFDGFNPLNEATTSCPQLCPDGMGTGGVTGAISSDGGTDVCNRPSNTMIFGDETGKFRLSPTDQCSL